MSVVYILKNHEYKVYNIELWEKIWTLHSAIDPVLISISCNRIFTHIAGLM